MRVSQRAPKHTTSLFRNISGRTKCIILIFDIQIEVLARQKQKAPFFVRCCLVAPGMPNLLVIIKEVLMLSDGSADSRIRL